MGVDEFALGFAGVDGDAMDHDVRVSGVERLVSDFVDATPVDRVSVFRPKGFRVEMVRTPADFSSGVKQKQMG